MSKFSLAGFKDPVRRPRYIIWAGVAVLVLAAVMIVALGVTSTRWFCSEGCHKVQDDTITAYRHSSHAAISCMACHMPVNANPVVFILHKAEALGELYMTVTNRFELPLNAESEVALAMKSTQCTQCHDTAKRKITASEGIVIDHKAHADKDVTCAICHNRVAHKEDFKLALKNPGNGEPNRKHEDFMSMTACFRCHTQSTTSAGIKAPGKCSACHTPGFQLKPPSHLQGDFFPKGHAKLAKAERKRVDAARLAAGEGSTETTAAASEGKSAEGVGLSLPKTETIDYCGTCHAPTFCTDCHGLEMPHPTGFKKQHGALGKKNPKVCANCHGKADEFCNACHHGSAMQYDYAPGIPWRRQHPTAVRTVGANTCFECHSPTFCASCHVSGVATK